MNGGTPNGGTGWTDGSARPNIPNWQSNAPNTGLKDANSGMPSGGVGVTDPAQPAPTPPGTAKFLGERFWAAGNPMNMPDNDNNPAISSSVKPALTDGRPSSASVKTTAGRAISEQLWLLHLDVLRLEQENIALRGGTPPAPGAPMPAGMGLMANGMPNHPIYNPAACYAGGLPMLLQSNGLPIGNGRQPDVADLSIAHKPAAVHPHSRPQSAQSMQSMQSVHSRSGSRSPPLGYLDDVPAGPDMLAAGPRQAAKAVVQPCWEVPAAPMHSAPPTLEISQPRTPWRRAATQKTIGTTSRLEEEKKRRSTNSAGESKEKNNLMENHSNVRQTLFPDKNDLVDKVMAVVSKPKYDVCNFYHETGFCQVIARSGRFETLSLIVIGVNAVYMAIDTDYNTSVSMAESHIIFQIVENAFCFYFLFEWVVRWISFKVKCNCLKDPWMVFDGTLLALMVMDTWVLTIVMMISSGTGGSNWQDNSSAVLKLVKVVRLLRTARMARLLRFVPELMIMVKGMAEASKTVSITLFMLFIIVYVYALAFRQVSDGSPLGEKYFKNMPHAMGSLLVFGVFPDMQEILMDMTGQHIVLGAVCLSFVLVSTLMVMNMLVGVLVEVVSVVAMLERDQIAATYVGQTLRHILSNIRHVDEAEEIVTISRLEFELLVTDRDAAKSMSTVGVDLTALVELTDFIFKDGDTLLFTEILKMVLQLRGSNQASVKDIVDLRKFMLQEMMAVEHSIDEVKKLVQTGAKNKDGLQQKCLSLED